MDGMIGANVISNALRSELSCPALAQRGQRRGIAHDISPVTSTHPGAAILRNLNTVRRLPETQGQKTF